MTSMQWPGLDQPRVKNEKKNDEYKKLTDAFVRCFDTQDGQVVLDFLRKKFKEQVVANPSALPQQAFFNEGQRDVVFYIEKLIKNAKESK